MGWSILLDIDLFDILFFKKEKSKMVGCGIIDHILKPAQKKGTLHIF